MNSKHPLGQLIEKVQQDNGWSDRDLAARAQSMELDLGKSNWSRLKNQPILTFKPSHIKGLALVLKQTETTVARAALASMGIDLEGYQDGDVKAAVRNNAELSARDKRVLLAVYRELSATSESALNDDLAQDMLDLAAHKGDRHIGPDELPYE
ncbi:hypothetical protein ACIQXM_01795 [Arthrobacter sp. NPDC097144]|uniref:hypothetical protein n=1 Tax=Arthrobacter sp. NPDC097144 TaxID=3363946 RepID=UPI00381F6694